ncbi:MAG: internalin N-terminal domain-containing protein [Proteobacteria bacterium]|nr:internalin N-terminal domain-containing protein [Pseudomonadota bacterium]MCL2307774.1 internalin N-terminal domain-containing protein [Pseudomonadota bacterium]
MLTRFSNFIPICFVMAGFTTMLLLVSMLGAGATHAQMAPPATIKEIFPDPALAAAVCRQLNGGNRNPIVTEEDLTWIADSLDFDYPQPCKRPGEYDADTIVTQSELAVINELGINNPQSFAGSEYLPNLKQVVVTNINAAQQLELLPNTLQKLFIANSSMTQLPTKLPLQLSLLSVSHTAISALPDKLPASLEKIYLTESQLAQLPELPASLKKLCVDGNQLTRLPKLPASLEIFRANRNQLARLPKLPTSLKTLELYDNRLTQLPILPTSLEELNVANNRLTRMPRLPASLKTLNLGNNPLKQLPELPASLEELQLGGNRLAKLPKLPASLSFFSVSDTQLTRLPEALPAFLKSLYAGNNKLNQLPNRLPTSLETIYVNKNQLTRLPDTLPTSLRELYADNNRLTQLPNTLPASLEKLHVGSNELTQLPDTLPASLKYLDANDNRLTQLPSTLPASLEELRVQNNQLIRLPDILPTSLRTFWASDNQLTQLPDTLPTFLRELFVLNNHLTGLPASLPPKLCVLIAAENQLVQYPWPVPENIEKTCCFNCLHGGHFRNHDQWVALPTLRRSSNETFDFDDFAPPILQYFKGHPFQDEKENFSAGTLANKGQWALTAPDGNVSIFAAGDGSEINSRLFTSPGLYRLSFEVTAYDYYFNLFGSTYTRAIIIDALNPETYQAMQIVTTDKTDKDWNDRKRTIVYADFSPQTIHLDQEGALFVFAYVPSTIALPSGTSLKQKMPFNDVSYWQGNLSDKQRLSANCSLTRPAYKGKIGFLQKKAVLLYFNDNADNSIISGAELYMGYGMGATSEQACQDMVSSQRFQKMYTVH